MRVSNSGINLIKKSEDFRSEMYLDPVGLPTIGYGTYLRTPELLAEFEYTKISESEATGLLMDHLEREVLPVIESKVKARLNQNQVDSLASFIYNLGRTNFSTSTLLERINEGSGEEEIRSQFYRWNKGRIDGKLVVLNGLATRRKEEADLYFKDPVKKKILIALAISLIIVVTGFIIMKLKSK
jgi:lysozyme